MKISSTSDFKDEVACAVKARPSDRVLFAPELADAIALVCGAAPGDVVTLDLTADFAPAGDAGRVVPAQIDLRTTLDAVDRELERRSAALLIVPAVAATTGEVLPLPALTAIAHRRGARLLVDGSDLVSRRAVNLTSHGIDYLVLSERVRIGPAVVVGRGDWLADCADAAGTFETTASPTRELVSAMGYEWSGLHDESMARWLDGEIDRLPGIRRLQLWPDARDRVGIAAVAVSGRPDPVILRWGAETGLDELARQLNSLAENVFEQEKS